MQCLSRHWARNWEGTLQDWGLGIRKRVNAEQHQLQCGFPNYHCLCSDTHAELVLQFFFLLISIANLCNGISCAIGKHREDYHVLFDYVRLSNGPIGTCDIFWNSLWLIFALKDHDQESRRGEVAQGLEVGLVRGGVLAGAQRYGQRKISQWNCC